MGKSINKVLFTVLMTVSVVVSAMAQSNDKWEELNNYSGVIGEGLNIGMTLIMMGNDISGVYFYHRWLKDIPIKGTVDYNRNIILNEYDQNGKVEGIFKGQFLYHAPEYGDAPLKYEVIEGFWSRPDGSEVKRFRVVLNNATYRPPGNSRYYVAGFGGDKEVEEFAQKLREAVISKEKKKVSAMVLYPINVNINSKDISIKNKADFIKNYGEIFHKSFYDKIKCSIAHNMFAKDEGVMLGDKGEIWIGNKEGGIWVIAINN